MSDVPHSPQLAMRRPHLHDLPPLIVPPGLVLRQAEPDDTEHLAKLLQVSFPEMEWTIAKVQKTFAGDPQVPFTFLIADEKTGTLLATASVQLKLGQEQTGTLHWVAADPAQKGRGLGALTTLATLHQMVRMGRVDADLTTDDFRLPALKTYLRLGFIPLYRHPSHWQRWEKITEILGSDVVPPPTLPPLITTVRVRTYELDSFGHVNNAAYLNYVEEARSEFLKQMGLSFHEFARAGVQFVIVEANVRYLHPARYGNEIVITGRIRDMKSVSAVLEYTLSDQQTGRVFAEAWTRGAFINAATGRPLRAPQPFRSAFTAAAISVV